MKNPYSGLDRKIYILFFVRIINRFGDFVHMLLALILTQIVGMDVTTSGLFVSLTFVLTCAGQFFGGQVADRLPRKTVLCFCQMGVALSYTLCAFFAKSSNSMMIPILIMLSSPCRGATAPVSNSMVADFSQTNERTQAFSLLYLGTNLGVAVGPMVASFLFAKNISLLFLASGLLMMLSSLVLTVFIPSVRAEQIQISSKKTLGLKQLFSCRPVLLYVVLSAFYCFCYSQSSFALPLEFADFFGSADGAVKFSLLMSVNAITVLVATPFVTMATKRFSHVTNISISQVFFACGYGMYIFVKSLPLFLIATGIWTIGEILMATNGNVFLNDYAPKENRGAFNGIAAMATNIGSALSPAVGAFILKSGGYASLWITVTFMYTVLALLFLLLKERGVKSGIQKPGEC